jgi:dihydrofolate synthase/folylpolyglutamate synthase
MGGAWDSTNTADGDVAVIAPIDIDHADRLGETIAEIAAVKAGIIKEGAAVVSARQVPDAESALRAAAAEKGATIAFEGADFALTEQRLAVGGQLISVQGLVGRYDDEYLPLYGGHQGFNAALAIAAVESLIGGASHEIPGDILAEGLGQVTSPGRLQLVGIAPTVLVDAAHNPHGARALATALRESFDFDEWGVVLGVLDDKDADGIVAALAPVASHVFATVPASERASDADRVADLAEARGLQVTVHSDAADAAEAARSWAAASDRRAVVIAGSVILAGEALALAASENWKAGWDE